MANNLTGDFEAVVEVSIRQINGLLANLHQSGVSEDAPMPLLHSVNMRVGGPRGTRPPVVGGFGDWVLDYQRARGPVGLNDLRAHLTANAPPGAAQMLADIFSKFAENPSPPPPPPDTVHGRVRAQLSSLTLSLPSGATNEVTVHAFVRADYSPDAGTTDLPKPLHGEVRATFEVQVQAFGTNRHRLLIQPSAQDSKIQFIAAPGSGLSAADVAAISNQVRKAVRVNFPLAPVELPKDLPGQTFPFKDFKGLGSGPGQAIALPFQLSGAPAPAGGIQSVNNLFTGPSAFALAVGKDFVKAQFQPMINHLLQFQKDISIRVGPVTVATYHASITSADLQFNDGSIDFIVNGKATHPVWWDYNFVVKQRVTLGIIFDALFILAPDSELTISGLPGAATDRVRTEITAERSRSLPPAQDALNQRLSNARKQLNDALHSFDPSMSAGFQWGHSVDPGASSSGAIAITPDGVIVRGDIGSTAVRYAPIINIVDAEQGQAFTALNSWIPGGRVERMTWSWVEYTNPSIWSGVTRSSPPEEHRFVFPKPPGITNASSMCLRLEGTQTSPVGQVSSVVGGTTCQVPDPGQVLDAPSWLEPVTVPIWLPDSTASATLKEVIAGHVSVQADTPLKNEFTHNYLVYFADCAADKPLEVLGKALGLLRRKDFSLVVIVVLPAGTFGSRRREVEARLGSVPERFAGRLQLTEDDEGGWTRTFAVSKTPSAYLINARREFVWKHEGEPDPKVLAGALEEHLVAAPAPSARPLRLTVAPGDHAPNVRLADEGGIHLHLRRLRGRAVLLNFWQAWSAPSVKELGRLERLQREAGEQAPFIVAFRGDKGRNMLGEIRKQYALSFVLTNDAEHRIARIFGVRCWPTTISVNADGLVEHVQFGITHEHALPPKDKAPEAY